MLSAVKGRVCADKKRSRAMQRGTFLKVKYQILHLKCKSGEAVFLQLSYPYITVAEGLTFIAVGLQLNGSRAVRGAFISGLAYIAGRAL